MVKQIPLRNKNKEVIEYAKVDDEHYEHLNQFKWCLVICGKNETCCYARGTIHSKTWMMHRYIKEVLLGEDISDNIIDHEDGDGLNNISKNILTSNYSDNNRNKRKKENTSSQYIGVHKYAKGFRVEININNKRNNAYFKNEHHCGHQYNLWLDEHDLRGRRNSVPEEHIESFVPHKKRVKCHDAPKGISFEKSVKKYRVQISGKHYGTFDTLEEAIVKKELVEKEIEEEQKNIVVELPPIVRNDLGIAIIKLYNKDKEDIGEVLVDDDKYYDLLNYRWYCDHGYAKNSKLGRMHRYLLTYTGKEGIDHINGKKNDNRCQNLRIATARQNSQNTSSVKNSSSKYIGVHKSGMYKNGDVKWTASIKNNGKSIHLGMFNDEIEAAKRRDEATLQYFGEFGRLNFPLS